MDTTNGWWVAIAVASLVLLLVGLVVVPLVIIRLPADYFTRTHPYEKLASLPLHRAIGRVARNCIAGILVAAGIAMLVLPGQGILTIVAGLLLAEMRWKRRLLRRATSEPHIQRSLNFVRKRSGKPSFEFLPAISKASKRP